MTGRWAWAGVAAAALLAAAPRSRAQDTARARADTDTVPPRTLPVNGQLLRAQHLRYRMSVVSPDSAHLVGFRDVDLRQTTYGAFPAWLVVETRGGSVPTADSLYLSYVDLRPLHWSAVIGRARLALEFTPDSVYGGTSGPSGSQTVQLAHGADLLAGDAMTEFVLELMPHGVGRVDSVSVLAVDLGMNRIEPAALSVDGEQDVDTPLGRIHCWVITLSTAAASKRFWVSEADPVVVRTRQDLPGRPGAAFEQMLVSRR